MARDAELAVLARAVQWALDDAAFEIGSGRYAPEQRRQLADQLSELADALLGGDHRMVIAIEGAVERIELG